MKELKSFYDSVGEHYDEEEAVYRTLRGRLRRKFVLDWLRRQEGALLEIGTNRGMYLAAYNGGPRVGVDLSLMVLRRARRLPTVSYAVADAERLTCFRPAVFDRVLCSEVIEHCFHPQRVFDSIAHVLKPGGSALITTPNYRGKRPEWAPLAEMEALGVTGEWNGRYFHTAFRPEELEQMARESGLRVLEAGTLEKQVKYAVKLPAALLVSGRALNRVLKSKRFGEWNEAFFQRFSAAVHEMVRRAGLEPLFLRFVKEGVRSYIIVEKSQQAAAPFVKP